MTLEFLKRFLSRRSSHSVIDRTVLLVSRFSREQNALRVISISEHWRLLIAVNLEVALQWLKQGRITVVLYDQDLPGEAWRDGVRTLLSDAQPVCLILLSPVVTDKLRRNLLMLGGYDVACKPLDREALAHLVNGALVLANDIDSCSVHAAQTL